MNGIDERNFINNTFTNTPLGLESPDFGEFSNRTGAERERLIKKLKLQSYQRRREAENAVGTNIQISEENNFQSIDYDNAEIQGNFDSELLSQILEQVGKDIVHLRKSTRLTPSKLEEGVRKVVDVEQDKIEFEKSDGVFPDLEKRARIGEILHYLASIVFSYYYILYQSESPSVHHIGIPFPEYNFEVLNKKFKQIFKELVITDETYIPRDEILYRIETNTIPNDYKDADEKFDAQFSRDKPENLSQYYNPTLSESFNMLEIQMMLRKSEYDLEYQIFILKVISGFKEYLSSFNALKEEVLMEIREEFHHEKGKIISAIVALKEFYDGLDWRNIVIEKDDNGIRPQIMFEANVELNCLDRSPQHFKHAFSHFRVNYNNAKKGESRRNKNKIREAQDNIGKKKNNTISMEKRIPLPEFYALEQILNNIFPDDEISVNIDNRIFHVNRDISKNDEDSLIKIGLQINAKLDMVVLRDENGKKVIDIYDFKSSTDHIEYDRGTLLNALIYRFAAVMLLIGNGVNPLNEDRLRYFDIELDHPEMIHILLNHTTFNLVDLRTGKIIKNDQIFGQISTNEIIKLIRIIHKFQEVSIVYNQTISKRLKRSMEMSYL